MIGLARPPFGSALGQLRVGQLYVKCPDRRVDFDDIAVLQQCDRPAHGRFRPDMADAEPTGRTGEPAVGDERDLAARALSAERTTSWCGFHFTLLRFSAIVRPVTVKQSPCKWPLSSSVFIRSGMPPASNMSLAT